MAQTQPRPYDGQQPSCDLGGKGPAGNQDCFLNSEHPRPATPERGAEL